MATRSSGRGARGLKGTIHIGFHYDAPIIGVLAIAACVPIILKR